MAEYIFVPCVSNLTTDFSSVKPLFHRQVVEETGSRAFALLPFDTETVSCFPDLNLQIQSDSLDNARCKYVGPAPTVDRASNAKDGFKFDRQELAWTRGEPRSNPPFSVGKGPFTCQVYFSVDVDCSLTFKIPVYISCCWKVEIKEQKSWTFCP